jgi:hypothetical protein
LKRLFQKRGTGGPPVFQGSVGVSPALKMEEIMEPPKTRNGAKAKSKSNSRRGAESRRKKRKKVNAERLKG